MAQIWLTYEEMGTLFDRTASAARDHAIESGWSRRRCSDGLTRVKMPGGPAHHYMMGYASSCLAAAPVDTAARGEGMRRDSGASAVADPAASVPSLSNPVHHLHRHLSSHGDEIVRKRAPREREWPEAGHSSDGEMADPTWANAVRRVFG